MDDLRCNSLRCRKSLALEGSAIVTTCSHIFCLDCAEKLFTSSPRSCPACETTLVENDDVVQTTLYPQEAYKTSVLSGLSPVTILDIASRAMNFFIYQMQQENAFQAIVTKNARDRTAVLEAQCQTIIQEARLEIHLLNERVHSSERELEVERRRVRDLQEMQKGSARAYSKLKAQLDKAQQRAMFGSGMMNSRSSEPKSTSHSLLAQEQIHTNAETNKDQQLAYEPHVQRRAPFQTQWHNTAARSHYDPNLTPSVGNVHRPHIPSSNNSTPRQAFRFYKEDTGRKGMSPSLLPRK